MPSVLEEKKFEKLKKYLPISFQEGFYNNIESLAQAFPLLSMMCKDLVLLEEMRAILNVNTPVVLSDESKSIKKSMELNNKMLELQHFSDIHTPFKYRLPIIMGEFPIHTRVINTAIRKFNSRVEKYHQDQMNHLNQDEIEQAIKDILMAIKIHGTSCDSDSLWQLLCMISGWSSQPEKWFHECPYLLYPSYACKNDRELKTELKHQKEKITPKIVESNREITHSSSNPFIKNYNHNINRAGLLDEETYILLLNAFGMKLGGHFDAQVKLVPRLIPMKLLHAIIHRQLSHRIDIPTSIAFDLWIEDALISLGVKQILQTSGDPSSPKLVNPFLAEPISFLNPHKIKQTLVKHLAEAVELEPSSIDLNVISQYLFDLLQSFQFNPGQALGIGANWDGTINLSNESGAYAFKFNESEAEWGKRFKEICLHRQGPAEALMNVMSNGIKFELGTIFSDFDYMSQLQPSEYAEVIRNAIIDNLVTDLFPEPAYHENEKYLKHQKQHVVRRELDGKTVIDSFYRPNKKGTYYAGKDGNQKQTPMFRKAGTLDVQAFPRRSASSEGYRESYADNPLVPLQMQYGQSMYKCTRGHIIYDPVSADQFLPDPFYGQILRSDNGDYLPFIGVVPKNYDRILKQPTELCASFILAKISSARLMVYSRTFQKTYEHIKTRFLPGFDAIIPNLPDLPFNPHIKNLHQNLNKVLAHPERIYRECEKAFHGLFKNLIYSLYDDVCYANDDNIKANYIQFIHSFTKSTPSRANLERFIRELIVNRPVSAAQQALQHYDVIVDYLAVLIKYFYPAPSESMAKKIADQADAYVEPLLASPSIRQYFEVQKKIPHANLSRKSTPSSLLSALQDGEIKNIWQHQKIMHEVNMPAGYRDPEGNQLTAVQSHEKRMDKIIKAAGAALQVVKKHDVLLGTSKLISEPVLGAKQAYTGHTDYKYAWGIFGGIKGIFTGIWKVGTSIPLGCIAGGECVHKNMTKKYKKNVKIDNPLAISAAPGNEPGLKVKLNMQIRDYLLSLLNRRSVNIQVKKRLMIARLIKIISLLYPFMNNEGKIITSAIIENTFPEVNWNKLLKPFSELSNHRNLIGYKNSMNTPFIQAVYACLTDSMSLHHINDVVKKYYKFYSLSSNQKNALLEFVEYYYRMQDKEAKKAFIDLFQFNGKLHKSLKERDKVIHKIQTWNNSIYSLASTLQRISSSEKKLYREALIRHDLSILDDYQLDVKVLNFLKAYAASFYCIDVDQQCEILSRCYMGKMLDENILSKKDKAHSQWSAFSQREFRHKLLERDNTNDIFLTLCKTLENDPRIINKLQELKNIYNYYFLSNLQIKSELLDIFYKKADIIIGHLSHASTSNQKEVEALQQAKTLLQNFVDITMNAVINSRLDNVNIFRSDNIENPLLDSKAIMQWLNGVYDMHQIRNLLDQQMNQAPSLDHTLWRDKCILQVLEINHPDQDRVHKTGLRPLLRVWAHHADNVTKTGETYFDHKTQQPQKVYSTSLLFDGSRTMQHAVDSSKKAFTFFRDVEYKNDSQIKTATEPRSCFIK